LLQCNACPESRKVIGATGTSLRELPDDCKDAAIEATTDPAETTTPHM
jgi:hypothetical protein